MSKSRLRDAFLLASAALLCGLAHVGVSREASQIPGLSKTYLNYSMYCDRGFMFDGTRQSYCYEGEAISYASVLKTIYWFPNTTTDASLFARTEKVYKLYIHGRAIAPTRMKTSFSLFSHSMKTTSLPFSRQYSSI